MVEVIRVAAAAIFGADGRLLISRRHDHLHQGGLWEFPGGKIEPGETIPRALSRELHEELGIEVTGCAPLITIPFDYPDKRVRLEVWRVTQFQGVPQGLEGQPLRWVAVSELDPSEFPAANRPIITALQLPDHYAITGRWQSADDLLQRAAGTLARGVSMLQLRLPGQSEEFLSAIAERLYPLCQQRRVKLILNGDPLRLPPVYADGIHLNRHRLQQLAASGLGEWRERWQGRWIGASCHNAEELGLARQLQLDYVSLSPLLPTASHPGDPTLGWSRFEELVKAAGLPVFALGGVGPDELSQVRLLGGQGVASISAFWR